MDMNREPAQDLEFTREFNHPLALLWKAWTDSEALKSWWGPDHFTCPTAQMDVREGGTSLVSMASPELGFPEQFSAWRYRKIVPMQRIEFIQEISDPAGRAVDPASVGLPQDFPRGMLTILDFEELSGGGCRLRVTEKGWQPGPMMEMSKMGMEQCLRKLAGRLRAEL